MMVRWMLGVVLLLGLVACAPDELKLTVDDLPQGNVGRGAEVFTQVVDDVPACSDCHALDNARKTGPSLAGFGTIAGERVNNQSAEEYAFNSIVRPASHVVRGFSNVMYNNYANNLSKQNIADLVAYLLNL
jgi:mono/diheme cytochrome c family protein